MLCVSLNQYLARSTLGALGYSEVAEMTAVQSSFMGMDHSIYASPKRKRGIELSEPRLITSGFRRGSDTSESRETSSPSSKVTGKFQRLDLQSPIDVHRMATIQDSEDESLPEDQFPAKAAVPGTSASQSKSIQPPQTSTFTFQSNIDFPNPKSNVRRSKSPPPPETTSDQFWQAKEITGWSPGDPDEDNYGVNGVGYHKTPAAAYALSQKRKQQIADYRSRETREARRARSQRRLHGRLSNSPQPPSPPLQTDQEKRRKKATRIVRFDDS